MLTIDNTVPYLLDRGLIPIDAVLDDDLMVAGAARRNLNLKITRREGPGFLIKQPEIEVGNAPHTLRCEAAFYDFCHAEPSVSAMTTLLPKLAYVDGERLAVVIELLADAKSLWEHCSSSDSPTVLADTLGLLGNALAVVHRTFRIPGPSSDPRLAWLQRNLPWVMQVHKPGPEVLSSISSANYETLKILQTQPGLGASLDRLRPLWQPTTVIHNDVKSDNVLVRRESTADGGTRDRLYLIDWELVGIGDPAWDLAGVLQDVIIFWVNSMSSRVPGIENMVSTARHPLPKLHTALRAFWRAYRAEADLPWSDAEMLIRRAVHFSAARLIQTAYEMAQMSTTLPAPSVLLLQVSANLLSDPETGQVQLYGLFQEVPLP